MKRVNYILLALLGVQLVVAAAIYWGEGETGNRPHHRALVTANSDSINRITLEGAAGARIELRRVDGQWQLPDYYKLPIAKARLDGLLSRLQGIKLDWPVATTHGAQDRFEVAEDHFQRRLQLFQGDESIAELFIGTSPGLRQVHLRRKGEDAIFAVALNSYDLPLEPKEWLDRTLMQPGEITTIEGGDFTLVSQGGAWLFQEPRREGDQPDSDKARGWVQDLSGLMIDEVVDSPVQGETMTVRVSGPQQQRVYTFNHEGDEYRVSRDDLPLNFRVKRADYERIVKGSYQQLLAGEQQSASSVPAVDAEAQ